MRKDCVVLHRVWMVGQVVGASMVCLTHTAIAEGACSTGCITTAVLVQQAQVAKSLPSLNSPRQPRPR